MNEVNPQEPLTLKNSLSRDRVKAKIHASNWEHAIELVGEVMIGARLVEERYVEAMKNALRELGPYSVLAPGIAMPHARPDDGVLQPGFALMTLETPVEFGNQENDPVDIVIAFCAVDKVSHVAALREIAALLSNDGLVQQLRAAEFSDQLAGIIQQVKI